MAAVIGTNPKVRAREAERRMRELARRRFDHFLRYRFYAEGRRLYWNWHLEYLCDVLEGVRLRDDAVRFLLIAIYAGSLKSETISQSWQAYMIGRRDDDDSAMVSAGNESELAARDSDKTRQILKSYWFRTLFPLFGVDPRTGRSAPWPKDTMDSWTTPGGAFREAVSTTTNTTGRGARRLLWDDILAAKDGTSDLVRTRTCTWLGETFRSRLRPPMEIGTITGVMQRIHELDPIGYLMRKAEVPYRLIEIPLEGGKSPKTYSYKRFTYVRAAGEIAHHQLFPPKVVAELKADMGENFEGQYNQRPVKMKGNFLKIDYLQPIDKTAQRLVKELGLQPKAYMDFGATEKQSQKEDPDYTVIVVVAKDGDGFWYILDVWRKQADGAEVARAIIAMQRKWNCQVAGEKGMIAKLIRPTLNLICQQMGVAVTLQEISKGPISKTAHALGFQMVLHSGLVHVPMKAPWLVDLQLEMAAFPRGSHDDQVDALSYAAQDLRGQRAGDPPKQHSRFQGELTTDQAEEILKRRDEARELDDDDDEELPSPRDVRARGDWWRRV